MKIDNIEKFIVSNKSEFEDDAPSDLMWQQIEMSLKTKRKKSRIRSISVAASLLILFASSMFLFQLKNDNSANADKVVNQEVLEAQSQFSSLIEIKRSELNQYKNDQPELINELNKQLKDLQLNYNALLLQLKDENKKDLIVQALIENLQLQLEVLNRSLEIVQNLNNKNHEKEVVQL